jgi:hypothetical protein
MLHTRLVKVTSYGWLKDILAILIIIYQHNLKDIIANLAMPVYLINYKIQLDHGPDIETLPHPGPPLGFLQTDFFCIFQICLSASLTRVK